MIRSRFLALSVVFTATATATAACGGDTPEAKTPPAETVMPSAPALATAAPVARVAATVATPDPMPRAPTPIEDTKILAFTRSADSLKLDKVGVADGALQPDGQKDAIFTLKVTGPFESVYITSVNAKGDTSGDFQGDTLTGNQTQPNEFAALRAGGRTVGIGVFEGDKLVNLADGSLSILPGGEHTYTLALANAPALKAGKSIRVFVQTPDHQVVAGPVLTK